MCEQCICRRILQEGIDELDKYCVDIITTQTTQHSSNDDGIGLSDDLIVAADGNNDPAYACPMTVCAASL